MLTDPNAWIALTTLTLLEIVLGIDNIIFIAILVSKLPEESRAIARTVGLSLAMITRILLLLSIVWIMKLTTPLFTLFELSFSGRDIILLLGGLFLIAKSTHEIHESLEISEEANAQAPKYSTFLSVIIQIALIDIIFSLDSVITAVGLAEQVSVMITAIIIAVFVMMIAAKSISDFVDRNPTIKMLALSFLILVGVALVGESFHFHIPKGYIYFAMAYAFLVEILNMKLRKSKKSIQLSKKI